MGVQSTAGTTLHPLEMAIAARVAMMVERAVIGTRPWTRATGTFTVRVVSDPCCGGGSTEFIVFSGFSQEEQGTPPRTSLA